MIVLTEAGSLTPSSTTCSLSALKRSSCSAFLYDLCKFNRLITFLLIYFFILHSQKVALHSKSEGIVAQEVGHHSNNTGTWNCHKTLCSRRVSLIITSTFAVRNGVKSFHVLQLGQCNRVIERSNRNRIEDQNRLECPHCERLKYFELGLNLSIKCNLQNSLFDL